MYLIKNRIKNNSYILTAKSDFNESPTQIPTTCVSRSRICPLLICIELQRAKEKKKEEKGVNIN